MSVWVLSVERGVEAGSDLRIFRERENAIEAARRYLTDQGHRVDLFTEADVLAAVESWNLEVADEYLVLDEFSLEDGEPAVWQRALSL